MCSRMHFRGYYQMFSPYFFAIIEAINGELLTFSLWDWTMETRNTFPSPALLKTGGSVDHCNGKFSRQWGPILLEPSQLTERDLGLRPGSQSVALSLFMLPRRAKIDSIHHKRTRGHRSLLFAPALSRCPTDNYTRKWAIQRRPW